MCAHWRRQAPPEVARHVRPAHALLALAGNAAAAGPQARAHAAAPTGFAKGAASVLPLRGEGVENGSPDSDTS